MNDSDIDFDELDRAVSSLVGGGPDNRVAAGDTITVVALKSEAAAKHGQSRHHGDMSPSEPKEVVSVAVKVDHKRTHAVTHTAPTSPLAAKRSGRMMDIIKPAAAVHKPVTSTRVRGPSREGVILQPLGPNESYASREEAPEAAVSAVPVQTPQDYHADGFLDDNEEGVHFLNEISYQTEPAPAPVVPSPVMGDAVSQQSPFITDARVEKRPLGMDGVSGEPTSPSRNDNSSINQIISPTPRLSIESLPEELNSEIIAIESGLAVDKPLPVRQITPAPRSASSVFTAPLAATVPSALAGDQPVAIFDTDHYHQQLRHPDGQESGWRFVFGIIFLLLLGAVSGAALYYFGII